MQKNTCLTVDNRKKIHDYISKYPGIHLGELIRISKLNTGTIRYHLKYLERNNFISKEYKNGYSRYFLKNSISSDNKKLFDLMRSKTTRDILLHMLPTVVTSQNEISKDLGKDPKTVEYHLKKLMKNDIIQKAIIENGKIRIFYNSAEYINKDISKNSTLYIIKEPYQLIYFLQENENRLFDKGFSKAVLHFLDENCYKGKHKSIDFYQKLIDRIVDWYLEIFPPFYIS